MELVFDQTNIKIHQRSRMPLILPSTATTLTKLKAAAADCPIVIDTWSASKTKVSVSYYLSDHRSCLGVKYRFSLLPLSS